MKYLLLKLNEEKYWFELDDNGCVNRQIVLDECNQMHVSCLEDCLAEDSINEEEIEGSIINLTKKEFDDFIAIYKGEKPFCLNKLVRYKVKSYDELNMWLVVDE